MNWLRPKTNLQNRKKNRKKNRISPKLPNLLKRVSGLSNDISKTR